MMKVLASSIHWKNNTVLSFIQLRSALSGNNYVILREKPMNILSINWGYAAIRHQSIYTHWLAFSLA